MMKANSDAVNVLLNVDVKYGNDSLPDGYADSRENETAQGGVAQNLIQYNDPKN